MSEQPKQIIVDLKKEASLRGCEKDEYSINLIHDSKQSYADWNINLHIEKKSVAEIEEEIARLQEDSKISRYVHYEFILYYNFKEIRNTLKEEEIRRSKRTKCPIPLSWKG